MSIRLDISQGVDPIPVYSDIRHDNYRCFLDGELLTFDSLPFTLKNVRLPGFRREIPCADKALILKHRNKAAIKDLARQEVVRA